MFFHLFICLFISNSFSLCRAWSSPTTFTTAPPKLETARRMVHQVRAVDLKLAWPLWFTSGYHRLMGAFTIFTSWGLTQRERERERGSGGRSRRSSNRSRSESKSINHRRDLKWSKCFFAGGWGSRRISDEHVNAQLHWGTNPIWVGSSC